MMPDLPTLLTALAALAVVLALVIGIGRMARLTGLSPRRAHGQSLRVEESLPLDPRRRLHLVACDGQRVLLLTGGTSDVVVGWLAPPSAPEPGAAP